MLATPYSNTHNNLTLPDLSVIYPNHYVFKPNLYVQHQKLYVWNLIV